MNNNYNLDIENIIKLAPTALTIGVVIGLIAGFNISIGGLTGLILIFAVAYCGVLYTQTILKTGAADIDLINLAINGAVLALIAEIIYHFLGSIIIHVRYDYSRSLFSIQKMLEAMILGAVGAIVWYAIDREKKKREISTDKK